MTQKRLNNSCPYCHAPSTGTTANEKFRLYACGTIGVFDTGLYKKPDSGECNGSEVVAHLAKHTSHAPDWFRVKPVQEDEEPMPKMTKALKLGATTPQHTRASILDTAKEYVTKDRAATHGDAEDNFSTIAKMWNNYIEAKTGIPIRLESKDTAAMMVLLKVARFAKTPEHIDHSIDAAGYSALMGEIALKEKV